jgi:C-terminal processing protease CtpA/Prc
LDRNIELLVLARFNAPKDGNVADVRLGSPAWKAGLGINTTIVAVDGKAYSGDVLYDAIRAAKNSRARPLRRDRQAVHKRGLKRRSEHDGMRCHAGFSS